MSNRNWKDALKDILQNPFRNKEAFKDKEVIGDIQNRKVVTIFDKYPKARYHFLVVPTKIFSGFSELNISHVSLLEDMKFEAEKIIEEIQSRDKSTRFRFGFHAVPSLSQIHMHVISQDFDSPCLKNKKHWNSFTTPFFIDADDFINILENEGEINLNKFEYEELLKGKLKCPNCSSEFPTIPKIKDHVKSCKIIQLNNNNNNNNNNISEEYSDEELNLEYSSEE